MYGYVIYTSEFQLGPWLLIHAGWRLFHRSEISTAPFDLFQYADICVICVIYRHMCNHSLLVSWLSPEKTVSWPPLPVLYVCLCTNGAWPLHWFIASCITTWVTHPSYQHDIVQARPILKSVLLFRFDNFRFKIYILSYTMSFVHQPDIFFRPTQKTPKKKKKKKKIGIPTNTHAPLFHWGQFDIIIETRVVCCPYDVRPFAVAMFVFRLKTASVMGPTCYDFYDLRETNISLFNGSNKRQTILMQLQITSNLRISPTQYPWPDGDMTLAQYTDTNSSLRSIEGNHTNSVAASTTQ